MSFKLSLTVRILVNIAYSEEAKLTPFLFLYQKSYNFERKPFHAASLIV